MDCIDGKENFMRTKLTCEFVYDLTYKISVNVFIILV